MRTTANDALQRGNERENNEFVNEEITSPLSGKVYFRNRADSNLFFARNAIATFPITAKKAVAKHFGTLYGVTRSKDDPTDIRVFIFEKDGVLTQAFVAKNKRLEEIKEPYFNIVEVYDPETQKEEIRVWIMEAPNYIDSTPEAIKEATSLLGW